jgi:CBS-domain-containing membrane protein
MSLLRHARLARLATVARSAAIATLVLTVIAALERASEVVYLASSLGSTVIVAYVFPESPFARWHRILAGHAVSCLVGALAVAAFGPGPYVAAAAVGVAILAMQATRSMQPPAGGDPILIASGSGDPATAAVSILAGALVVAAGAGALAAFRSKAVRTPAE